MLLWQVVIGVSELVSGLSIFRGWVELCYDNKAQASSYIWCFMSWQLEGTQLSWPCLHGNSVMLSRVMWPGPWLGVKVTQRSQDINGLCSSGVCNLSGVIVCMHPKITNITVFEFWMNEQDQVGQGVTRSEREWEGYVRKWCLERDPDPASPEQRWGGRPARDGSSLQKEGSRSKFSLHVLLRDGREEVTSKNRRKCTVQS